MYNPSASSRLQPLGPSQRVFETGDHAALWFSLGVGLLVMQVGAYLVPALGPREALLAILAGSAIGAGLLAWTAQIACSRGLSSAALMAQTLGDRFARLPVIANIVQLIGWTAFELVVMRDGTAAIARQVTGTEAGWVPLAATLGWGLLLLLLASGSMVRVVRRFIGRWGLPLVVLSLVWLTWQFGQRVQAQGGWNAFWLRPGSGGMSTVAAIDLVMAMPISWLPLVADYARYGTSSGGALGGTWFGYTVANVWCYALGVLVMGTMAPGAELVATLLLAQGGLIALGLILVDEMDNAYGDIHSGAVSLNFLAPGGSVALWGMGLTVLSVGCALVLPMHGLEPFLLLLSSVFVPLFGVVISQLAGGGSGTQHSIDWPCALLWLAGIGVFHLGPQWWPAWGSALPSLALTLGLGLLLRFVR